VFLRLFLALLVLGSPALAADRTHQIVPEDYFTLSSPLACDLSPDGSKVAYTEMRWVEEEDKRNTDLWVVEVAGGRLTRLTFDMATDSNPVWSPDSRWIYFTSSRKRDEGETPPYNGKKQVWRVSPNGGDIVAVTRLADGVGQFDLSADGRHLVYTTAVEQVAEDGYEDLRSQFKELTYGHGIVDNNELWRLDLETWRAERLVSPERVIEAFALSPDGRRAALLTNPDETLLSNEGWTRVEVWDLAAGTMQILDDTPWREGAHSPYGWFAGLDWSPDGEVLSFRVDFDGYQGEVFFIHFDAGAEPVTQKMERPDEVTVDSVMQWLPGSRTFCFAADDHARRRVIGLREVRAGGAGEAITFTPGDVAVADFDISDDGTLAVLMPGLDHPPDIFLVERPGLGAEYRRITRLNPQVDTWKVPRLEIARWTSEDGTPVEGVLELPPDWKPEDGPLPLLVAIHGGPTSCTTFGFRFWIYGRTLYAANGWAVLDPNYRGSTGYGDRFLTDLVGNKNNLDVQDILAGVDHLIARGIADPERMALTGWSNGGYLTNCIITQDPRFKAASTGAGVFDVVMQWSIEDTPGHVINFSGGLPWEVESTMRASSPLFDADKIRTPTLIHVGEHDERVPQEHSRSLYRALRHYLEVPVELIVYPGEGHGLTKYSHRKAKIMWDQEWFRRHVLEAAPATEASPESD
jgi:dipeptidyl aminopeptidase/acylaminoacyl peptidase